MFFLKKKYLQFRWAIRIRIIDRIERIMTYYTGSNNCGGEKKFYRWKEWWIVHLTCVRRGRQRAQYLIDVCIWRCLCVSKENNELYNSAQMLRLDESNDILIEKWFIWKKKYSIYWHSIFLFCNLLMTSLHLCVTDSDSRIIAEKGVDFKPRICGRSVNLLVLALILFLQTNQNCTKKFYPNSTPNKFFPKFFFT